MKQERSQRIFSPGDYLKIAGIAVTLGLAQGHAEEIIQLSGQEEINQVDIGRVAGEFGGLMELGVQYMTGGVGVVIESTDIGQAVLSGIHERVAENVVRKHEKNVVQGTLSFLNEQKDSAETRRFFKVGSSYAAASAGITLLLHGLRRRGDRRTPESEEAVVRTPGYPILPEGNV